MNACGPNPGIMYKHIWAPMHLCPGQHLNVHELSRYHGLDNIRLYMNSIIPGHCMCTHTLVDGNVV